MKRKRDSVEAGTTPGVKPAKHTKFQCQPSTARQPEVESSAKINAAIGKMDNCLLADFVAQRTKRFGDDLSLVELEDMHIPERAILDTSEWDQERQTQALPDFLIHFTQPKAGPASLTLASSIPGAPHTLVVTAAGLRAADLTRVLRNFQTKDATVAKLFAKHIKLKDAIAYVKRTRMSIGVGTPARILDLLTSDALTLESLERIVIDCSFLDQKKRSIFDMKETQQPLMQLLSSPELKTRYTSSSSQVKLIFY